MTAPSLITFLCWDDSDGTTPHCTRLPGHSNPHYNAYSRIEWPQRPGEAVKERHGRAEQRRR